MKIFKDISCDISKDFNHLISHTISRVLISRISTYDIHQLLKLGYDITFDIKSLDLPKYRHSIFIKYSKQGLDITFDIKSIGLPEY